MFWYRTSCATLLITVSHISWKWVWVKYGWGGSFIIIIASAWIGSFVNFRKDYFNLYCMDKTNEFFFGGGVENLHYFLLFLLCVVNAFIFNSHLNWNIVCCLKLSKQNCFNIIIKDIGVDAEKICCSPTFRLLFIYLFFFIALRNYINAEKIQYQVLSSDSRPGL